MKSFFTILFFSAYLHATSQGVGLGTNSPSASAILELKSSTKGLLFPRTSTTTRNTIAGVKGLMVYDTTLSQFFYHTGSGWSQVATGPIVNHWSSSGVHISNNNTGNVGIGIPLPPYKFSVYGGDIFLTSDDPALRISAPVGSSYARIRLTVGNQDPDFNITQVLNKLYISRNIGGGGYANDLMISNQGYVGIGTGDPETKLHVYSNADVENGSDGIVQIGLTGGNNIGIDANEIQGRFNGGVSRLVLNYGGGTVQIGNATAPTTYSLAINGRVVCEGLKIQGSTQWSDYVFADDYDLRSFDDLRKFIAAHHHLPNIPSAAVVEKEGIDVEQMSLDVMEKIEELTLYVLQLEEKIRKIEKGLDVPVIIHK